MDEEELYSLISFVSRSKNRKKIMMELEDSDPQTPTELAENIEVQLSHVSSQLGKLGQNDLVKPLNPEDKHHRYYRLTEKGEQILSEID